MSDDEQYDFSEELRDLEERNVSLMAISAEIKDDMLVLSSETGRVLFKGRPTDAMAVVTVLQRFLQVQDPDYKANILFDSGKDGKGEE